MVARGLKKAKAARALKFQCGGKGAENSPKSPFSARYLDLCGKSMSTKRDVSDMVPANTWLFLTVLTGDVDPCLMMRWLAP